jgi:hypothetical protein
MKFKFYSLLGLYLLLLLSCGKGNIVNPEEDKAVRKELTDANFYFFEGEGYLSYIPDPISSSESPNLSSSDPNGGTSGSNLSNSNSSETASSSNSIVSSTDPDPSSSSNISSATVSSADISSSGTSSSSSATGVPTQILSLTATPQTGDAPLAVVFNASAIGDGVTAASYLWGGQILPKSGVVTFNEFFPNPGSYTISLTVSGTSGSVSQDIVVTVTNPVVVSSSSSTPISSSSSAPLSSSLSSSSPISSSQISSSSTPLSSSIPPSSSSGLPALLCGANPTSVPLGSQVTFSVSNGNIPVLLQFGDGTSTSLLAIPGLAPKTYATYGSFTATFSSSGFANCTQNITVIPPPLYDLTVANGSGSGSHPQGTAVNVAGTPSAGQCFVNWTGTGASYLSSTTTQSAVLTMPAQAVSITANYTTCPVLSTSVVGTTNGDASLTPAGTNTYTPNQVVATSVVAKTPLNKCFTGWTGDQTSTAASINVTMNTSKTLVANYTDCPVLSLASAGATAGTPTLTGAGVKTIGQSVAISATNNIANTDCFSSWTGNIATVVNPNAASTSVTVNSSISLTANYVACPTYTLAVGGSGTTGSGTYIQGASVPITAPALSGELCFDTWTGNTTTISSLTSASTSLILNGNWTVTPTYDVCPGCSGWDNAVDGDGKSMCTAKSLAYDTYTVISHANANEDGEIYLYARTYPGEGNPGWNPTWMIQSNYVNNIIDHTVEIIDASGTVLYTSPTLTGNGNYRNNTSILANYHYFRITLKETGGDAFQFKFTN